MCFGPNLCSWCLVVSWCLFAPLFIRVPLTAYSRVLISLTLNSKLTLNQQVGRVYRMCPVTLESALYFLDSYLVETMDHERKLAAADFQVGSYWMD